jgi:hypothetical protein
MSVVDMIGGFSIGDSRGTKLSFEFEGGPYREGWVGTSITYEAPGLRGGDSCTIHYDDLEHLASSLGNCANSFPGNFSFTDMEENVELTVRLDRFGKGQINALFTTNSADLVLRIETDQSGVRVAAEDLKRLVASIRRSNRGRLA